MFSLQSHY